MVLADVVVVAEIVAAVLEAVIVAAAASEEAAAVSVAEETNQKHSDNQQFTKKFEKISVVSKLTGRNRCIFVSEKQKSTCYANKKRTRRVHNVLP